MRSISFIISIPGLDADTAGDVAVGLLGRPAGVGTSEGAGAPGGWCFSWSSAGGVWAGASATADEMAIDIAAAATVRMSRQITLCELLWCPDPEWSRHLDHPRVRHDIRPERRPRRARLGIAVERRISR